MNIFKRIANWIIHKLGGYTEEELIVEVDKGVKVFDLVAKEAGRLAMYWHQRYNTEHENYLAMLNLYSTTVEQMQNNAMGVAGAIDTIKAYCKSKGSCDECALYNKNGGCKIHEIPCYWGE